MPGGDTVPAGGAVLTAAAKAIPIQAFRQYRKKEKLFCVHYIKTPKIKFCHEFTQVKDVNYYQASSYIRRIIRLYAKMRKMSVT